jgi:hypothetical protein
MKYYQTFTVTGSGHFPLDMLRYDHCWPSQQSEIYLMNIASQTRRIQMARRVDGKSVMPTTGRWESFGWQVSAVSTMKVL